MDYVITFSDVMAALITFGLGVMGFFIKRWFGDIELKSEETQKKIEEGNEKIQERIEKNDKKVNERIDKLEEKTGTEIENLKQELKSIEKDFPIVYVQRDDFFRSMNSVEEQMKDINQKMDRLLMQSVNRQ